MVLWTKTFPGAQLHLWCWDWSPIRGFCRGVALDKRKESEKRRIAVWSLAMFVVGWIQKPRFKNSLHSKKYVSPFPAFPPSSVIICFVNLDHSVFVRWNLNTILIFIFRMVKDFEHLLKCFSFVFHFLRTLYLVLISASTLSLQKQIWEQSKTKGTYLEN